jgi:hypothetical protein
MLAFYTCSLLSIMYAISIDINLESIIHVVMSEEHHYDRLERINICIDLVTFIIMLNTITHCIKLNVIYTGICLGIV